MIKKVIFIFIFILITGSICWSNPLLIAEPLETTYYYIINIDGKDQLIPAGYDNDFIYDLIDLKEGSHYIKITGVNKWGSGGTVPFILIKKIVNNKVEITLKETPIPNDPYYKDRFIQPLKIKVENTIPLQPKKKGNGGNCFISTIW